MIGMIVLIVVLGILMFAAFAFATAKRAGVADRVGYILAGTACLVGIVFLSVKLGTSSCPEIVKWGDPYVRYDETPARRVKTFKYDGVYYYIHDRDAWTYPRPENDK